MGMLFFRSLRAPKVTVRSVGSAWRISAECYQRLRHPVEREAQRMFLQDRGVETGRNLVRCRYTEAPDTCKQGALLILVPVIFEVRREARP